MKLQQPPNNDSWDGAKSDRYYLEDEGRFSATFHGCEFALIVFRWGHCCRELAQRTIRTIQVPHQLLTPVTK